MINQNYAALEWLLALCDDISVLTLIRDAEVKPAGIKDDSGRQGQFSGSRVHGQSLSGLQILPNLLIPRDSFCS